MALASELASALVRLPRELLLVAAVVDEPLSERANVALAAVAVAVLDAAGWRRARKTAAAVDVAVANPLIVRARAALAVAVAADVAVGWRRTSSSAELLFADVAEASMFVGRPIMCSSTAYAVLAAPLGAAVG